MKSLAENWKGFVSQAEENLHIKEVREELRNLISALEVKMETFETKDFPFLDGRGLETPWGHSVWSSPLIFANVEGNHELSFSSRNRLGFSDTEREAFRLMEGEFPLVELEKDGDGYHYHYLFLRLGEIDGKTVYLKISEATYNKDED